MRNYEFSVVFESEKDGGYSVYCPMLPGCVSQGDTYEEALANIKEAIRGYVKSLIKDGLPVPQEERFEKIDVSV